MNYRVRLVTNGMKGVRTESYATKKEALKAIPLRKMSISKILDEGTYLYIVYPQEGNSK